MPYIPEVYRKRVDEHINNLVVAINDIQEGQPRIMDGVVNYCITKLLLGTIACHLQYSNIVRAIGTCTAIIQEFYRRIAGPYEDKKRDMEGEVF